MSTGKMLLVVAVVGLVMFLIDGAIHGMALSSTYNSIAGFDGASSMSPLWRLLVDIVGAVVLVWFYGKAGHRYSSPIMFSLMVGVVVSVPNVFISALMIKGFPYWLAWVWVAATLVDYAVAGVIISMFNKPKAA